MPISISSVSTTCSSAIKEVDNSTRDLTCASGTKPTDETPLSELKPRSSTIRLGEGLAARAPASAKPALQEKFRKAVRQVIEEKRASTKAGERHAVMTGVRRGSVMSADAPVAPADDDIRLEQLGSASAVDSDVRTEASNSADGADDEVYLTLPSPCSGSLTQGLDGRLRCENDHGVQGVLNLMHELNPEALRELQLPPGDLRISIEWDQSLMEKMGQFMNLTGGNILLATDLLRDAIEKGDKAFTASARIPGTEQHPSELLRSIGLRVSVPGHDELARVLQRTLEQNPSTPEHMARLKRFRNDFGAFSLISLANNKDFNRQLGYALGASLVGTGSIGAAFDYGIWSEVKRAMGPKAAATWGPALDSMTPEVAETFDSMVVARLLTVMQGGNFLPDSFGEALNNLKGAMFSGTIAAIGSVANNYVRDLLNQYGAAGHTDATVISLLVAKQLTNLLATWTSGAMVPLELMNDRKELTDAKLKLIQDGVIPEPDVPDIHKHVSDSALDTLRAARGTGSAVRSMAMGGEIAFVIGLALSILEQKGIMPSSVEQLITLIYSTPTEVISMTSTMLAERYVGKNGGTPGARITTDAGKQSTMLAQITGSSKTTRKDLDLIARPEGERNAALGQLVTLALGKGMHYVDQAADLGLHYAGIAAAPIADALGPVVGPVLNPVGRAIAAGAQVVSDDVLKPAGRAALHAAGAVHENAVMPAGRVVTAVANFASPVLNPVERGIVTAAKKSGQYALPFANAVAASVDGAARAPGVVGQLADKYVVKPAVVGIDSAVSQVSSSLRQMRRRDEEPNTGDNNV